MGCIDTITYDKFPKQKDENYKYPEFKVGSRVEVCYHFDASKCHYGTIVRDDLEEPFETIIKLDNGRYLRAVECQYSYIDEEVSDDVCEWRYNDSDSEKLCEYKNLDEQGLLLRLPCKVGDTVYLIKSDGKVVPRTADMQFLGILWDYYGKEWFLTQTEAEQKLKEMECD